MWRQTLYANSGITHNHYWGGSESGRVGIMTDIVE